MVQKTLKLRLNRLIGKNLMIMLSFTRYLRFLNDHMFIFSALKIVENRVSLVFIVASLLVKLVNILFTRFITAF